MWHNNKYYDNIGVYVNLIRDTQAENREVFLWSNIYYLSSDEFLILIAESTFCSYEIII